MINKTFSKGDMIDIIRNFNIDIPNFASMDKPTLSMKLWEELCSIEFLPCDNDIYDINNIEELKHYLMNKNPNKLLSVKDKTKLMRFCKEVIVYCNNGYNIDCSVFNDFNEIKIQMEDICKYGDIPSVRRAIRLFNEDPKLDNKLEPVISNRIKKQLELKEKSKVKKYYGAIFKKGHFVLEFE
jgi:hypothetical protein